MTEEEAERTLEMVVDGQLMLFLPADHRCPLDIRIIRRGDTFHTEFKLEGKHDWTEFTVDGEPSRVTDLRAAIGSVFLIG
jgi:hypothetical protein